MEEIMSLKFADNSIKVDSIVTLGSWPQKKDGSVQAHVAQKKKKKKLQYYMDPETGLHAINHFVLY